MALFATFAMLLGIAAASVGITKTPCSTAAPITAAIAMAPPVDMPTLPTTINSVVYVANTSVIYNRAWAAMQTPQADPACCSKKAPEYNKTLCRYEQCMRDFYKGKTVTTVYPVATNQPDRYWYTDAIKLTAGMPHWGTMKKNKAYYPATMTAYSTISGSATVTHQLPALETSLKGPVRARIDNLYNKPPPCWDESTCCYYCWRRSQKGGFFRFNNLLDPHTAGFWLWVPGVVMTGLSLLCCMPLFAHRRRKRAADQGAGTTPDQQTQQIIYTTSDRRTVVSPAADGGNTQVITTTTREAVDPALIAGGAGAAGAAAAANEKSRRSHGDNAGQTTTTNTTTSNSTDPSAQGRDTATSTGVDTGSVRGRGTVRRQAEEGRARVQFADEKAGQLGENVVRSGKEPGQEVVTVVESKEQ
ncbi:hypothetical protein BAUCODRAFT_127990 [Baudoinia panamericana UAMH 10762]|uniref:Uncharacterized protein n=1 Tax=Baudoinia panamericana (strain UAMH 10762) TaxID=717646 RepID=M2M1L3_BAUPA|nr:uncharacterized protein BAUCODRAFT_127990 [Baudoinia panamericana UAMH 10762]EMD00943.1 hypothetical protein BAUCODRAFT_127990 [Baudoinia panamericana UAMH 10762]